MKKLPENFSTDLWQKVIDGNRKIFESIDGNSLVSSLENFFFLCRQWWGKIKDCLSTVGFSG
jgi:hypothetical protein